METGEKTGVTCGEEEEVEEVEVVEEEVEVVEEGTREGEA